MFVVRLSECQKRGRGGCKAGARVMKDGSNKLCFSEDISNESCVEVVVGEAEPFYAETVVAV